MIKRNLAAFGLLAVMVLFCACSNNSDIKAQDANERLKGFVSKPFSSTEVAWGDSYDDILKKKKLEVYGDTTLIDEHATDGKPYDFYRDIYFFETGGMMNRCNTLYEYSDQDEYYNEIKRLKDVLQSGIGEPNGGTLETFDYLPPENGDVLYCMWLAGDGSKLEILLSDNRTKGSATPFYIMIKLEGPTTA